MNTLRKTLWICGFILVNLLHACNKAADSPLPTVLKVDQKTLNFESTAGSTDISVNASAAYTATVSPEGKSWCQTSINGSKLTIRVSESPEKGIREASILVQCGEVNEKINIKQLGWAKAILLSPEILPLQAIGGGFQFKVTANVEYQIMIKDCEWLKEAPPATRGAHEMVERDHKFMALPNKSDQKRSYSVIIKDKDIQSDIKATLLITQEGSGEYTSVGIDDIKNDIKLSVVSGEASSTQSGEGIEKSFDGNMNTIYHSNWNNQGSNYFPITLTYYFADGTDMDYLVYYPRTNGGNGNFKEVEIRVKSNANTRGSDEWNTVITKNLGGGNGATRINFLKSQIGVKAVQFVVKSGSGDGQGFATCSEMEFYKKNPDAFNPLTLFTDLSCSELKPGITDENIENCSYSFYKNIAFYMKQSKYPSEFRIQEYKAYPHPDQQAKENKTNPYSLLDNPTGISVKEGEDLVVLIGNIQGQTISLKIQNLDRPAGDGFGGDSYPLSEGINKIKVRNKGLAYIMYHTPDFETAQPIKIHIASGAVNGYYDSRKHSPSDWKRLLDKAVAPYFDVVGKYAHLTFPTYRFRTLTPDGKALIDAYDQIVNAEMELMGLYKYNKVFKNRMYLNVIYTSYMYATSYHTAYNNSTLEDLCNVNKLTTSSCWGPAHEIGHCNQTRPGFKWHGTTEVTTNVMSQYIQTSIFKRPSRLQTEDMGSGIRNRYSKAWSSILVHQSSHAQEEDVFCKLVPFWQLQLYFGNVLGKTPLQQMDKGGFYPDVFEYVRTHPNLPTSGEQQTEFVYIASLAAKMNLLDFFSKWGFLTPVDKIIDDYGQGQVKVTQTRINEIKRRVEGLGYPEPDVALEYITDNTVELYKNKPEVIAGTATRSGQTITTNNWKNVVAYEVVNENNQKKFISDGVLDASANATFTINTAWSDSFKVYAVSATGKRTLVTFK